MFVFCSKQSACWSLVFENWLNIPHWWDVQIKYFFPFAYTSVNFNFFFCFSKLLYLNFWDVFHLIFSTVPLWEGKLGGQLAYRQSQPTTLPLWYGLLPYLLCCFFCLNGIDLGCVCIFIYISIYIDRYNMCMYGYTT